jgi:hypothetical protein
MGDRRRDPDGADARGGVRLRRGGVFEHHARWDQAIEVERTSAGPVGKGSTGVEIRRFMGGKQRASFEITEFERPSWFAFRNTSGPFELDRANTFERDGAGPR